MSTNHIPLLKLWKLKHRNTLNDILKHRQIVSGIDGFEFRVLKIICHMLLFTMHPHKGGKISSYAAWPYTVSTTPCPPEPVPWSLEHLGHPREPAERYPSGGYRQQTLTASLHASLLVLWTHGPGVMPTSTSLSKGRTANSLAPKNTGGKPGRESAEGPFQWISS